ncbi:10276_t:CDS:2, partial [Ambispora leptoticha]
MAIPIILIEYLLEKNISVMLMTNTPCIGIARVGYDHGLPDRNWRRSEVVAVPGTIHQRQVSVLSKWKRTRPRITESGHDNKQYLNIVNLDSISMPTPICSRVFNKIEEMNPDISINVWEWDEETATPKSVIANKNYNRQHIIYFIALTDFTKNEDDIYDTKYHSKKHLCNRCFQSWSSENTLAYHQEHCFGLGEATQRVNLSVKGVNDFEKFKNYGRMINAPCVIIADFEADNKKCDKAYGRSMHKLMKQKANSFCYLVHWIDTGDVWGPFLYRGENAIQEFVRQIDQELVNINRVLAYKADRIETEEDKKRFSEAVCYWICKDNFNINTDEIKRLEKEITSLKVKLEALEYNSIQTTIDKMTKAIASKKAKADKVWNHCHITGYDSHLVCESVGRSVNAQQIKVIAKTFERYKSMKVGQFKYIDSQQFMNNSLANLMKNLGTNYPITSQHYRDYSPEQIALVYHKRVYSYEYIDSYDRFLETELPPIYEFHGRLNGKISQKDYDYAQKVWKEFGCRNLGDHYVSAPALAWDAMLKMTGVKIGLFTDMAMHDFIKKAKRGGIAMACKRYLKANNPKMAMSQYLPIGGYEWLASRKYLLKNPDKQKQFLDIILKTKVGAKQGYYLNIKVHFPKKTHDYLSDLPPAVENIALPRWWTLFRNRKISSTPWATKRLRNSLPGALILCKARNKKRNEAKKAGNTFLSDFFKLMNNSVYGKTIENVHKYQDFKLMTMNNEQDEKKFIKQ